VPRIALDVADRGDVRAFVDFARRRFGRVDVNIKGVLDGIAAVLPLVEAQGSGHIIGSAGRERGALRGFPAGRRRRQRDHPPVGPQRGPRVLNVKTVTDRARVSV
jgi:NAD(P)-dependent dehydrogenase (short-subunit alcohol dehydrogenase family)